MNNGTPDGMRLDSGRQPVVRLGHGRRGARTAFPSSTPKGKLIGRIDLPERCANLCFGGTHRNRLFMCASTSVYSLYVNTQGACSGVMGGQINPTNALCSTFWKQRDPPISAAEMMPVVTRLPDDGKEQKPPFAKQPQPL